MKAHCLVCDDRTLAVEHPDWLQREKDGHARATLCLNSPYVAKTVWPWMTHALNDPSCNELEIEIPNAAAAPCWCEACTQHLQEAGADVEATTAREEFARGSVQRFKDETSVYAEAVRPGATVTFRETRL